MRYKMETCSRYGSTFEAQTKAICYYSLGPNAQRGVSSSPVSKEGIKGLVACGSCNDGTATTSLPAPSGIKGLVACGFCDDGLVVA